MTLVKNAIFTKIELVPAQPAAHVSPTLTARQKRICAELGISEQAFLRTKATGELFAGTGARRNF
ncbi:MAG: hypothetical protein IT377_27790 [Polyangiaceae bacterium]|nr:hypothetical protein [Polyangiaceae bacterium]